MEIFKRGDRGNMKYTNTTVTENSGEIPPRFARRNDSYLIVIIVNLKIYVFI